MTVREAQGTRRRARSWSDAALSAWSVLVFLFLFAPIIVIIISSFNTGRLLVAWSGFGFDGFLALLEKPAIQNAVWVSIQTAGSNAGRSAVRISASKTPV